MDRNLIQAITAEKAVQTPFYVFDIDQLRNHLKHIRSVLGDDVKLCYAMKANPLVVKEMQDLVDAYEVCSPGEYRICQRANIPNDQIILSGVYKNKEDIKEIMGMAVQPIYTIESLEHLKILDEMSRFYQKEVTVLIRLTSGNQFGLDEIDIHEILKNKEQYPYLKWEGIQLYSGTQKTKAKKIQKELEKLKTFIQTLEMTYDLKLNTLEFGPGLAVSYFEEKEDTGLNDLNKALNDLEYEGVISLEIGRYMVASCGTYVSAVVDKKCNHEKNYAILDGGIHHVNYYGQFLGMKHPFIDHIKTNEANIEEKTWELCGALCTVADVLVKDMPFNGLDLNDLLVFKNVGAYSITESIFLFLSRDMPQVLFYTEEKGAKIVRDIIQTDVINSVKEQ